MSSEAAFPTFAIHKSFIYMLGTYIIHILLMMDWGWVGLLN